MAAFLLPAIVETPAMGETVRLHVASGTISDISDRTNGEHSLWLKEDSIWDFSQFTQRHLNEKIEVVIDDNVLSSPVIREPQLGPIIPLQMSSTDAEFRDLIVRLISGAAVLEVRSTGEAFPLKRN